MKIGVVVLLAVALAGCSLEYIGEDWDYSTACTYTFQTLDELQAWVRASVVYASDSEQYGNLEYWASPAETLASMRGDCDDRAILFLYIAHHNMKIDGLEYVSVMGPSGKHAVVSSQGIYYLGLPNTDYKVIRDYNYGQAIWISTNTHNAIK
jgi:hypothetical protein